MLSETKKTDTLKTRTEHDSMGPIEVPWDSYWGAQTQRSLKYFSIGEEKMPRPLLLAFILQKKVAALTNMKLGILEATLGNAIVQAADEILKGNLADQFPLSVWQTGSGTQTNMNINEVLANRAIELLGGQKGSKKTINPNDQVNQSQSSNDSFPTAMHIASVFETHAHLLPALTFMIEEMDKKVKAFSSLLKLGRTHLQDATPLTLGQEFSGYLAQLKADYARILNGLEELYLVAQGGTAVGTGLNAPKNFATTFAQTLKDVSGFPFCSTENKFAALSSHGALVSFSGILNTLATSVFKIANDIRLLGSGPRAGIRELLLPENEPGSSIMPGKVNPTQCEALTMIAIQVIGNNVSVSMAGTQGYLELNTYKPLIIYNVLQSIRLLADGIKSFTLYCLQGLQPNIEVLKRQVESSLMLVTALSPHIGHDKAAEITKLAEKKNLSLKEASLLSGYVSQEQFDQWVRPEDMISGYNLKIR